MQIAEEAQVSREQDSRKPVPQKPVLEVLCAIQGALGTENQRVFAKAGLSLGRKWAKGIPRAASVDDLMEKVAEHLRNELLLGQSVELVKEEDEYVFRVRGCHICHGKMVRERHDISPACVMSMFPVGAATGNLGVRNARLKEIRKPGPIGDCDLVYVIKE